MMNSKIKKTWIKLEDLIIYSPFVVVFLVIFNVPDSKYLASRVMLASSLYLAVRFYQEWKNDLQKKRTVINFALFFCCYFFFMQYYNDGNSDFPRAVLYSLFYFVFFPLSRFKQIFLFYLTLIAVVFIGASSYFQVFYLGMDRAGLLAINPIPYSYFSGVCLIIILYFIMIEDNKFSSNALLGYIGVFLSLSSIVLTQTRATLLAVFIVFIVLTFYHLIMKPSRKKVMIAFIGYLTLPLMLWSIPIVKQRVYDVVDQIHNYEYNDYNSSSGIRIKLWQSGLDIASENIFFGTKRSQVQDISLAKITNKKYPQYLSEFLIHPNTNFHNQYIQTLVDSGIFGLILIFIFIFSPVLIFLKCNNDYFHFLSIAMVFFTGICMWFDSLFLYNHTVILYSLIILVSFGIRYNEKKSL
ncbi:O-antigen ligase family protein [Vibrio mimicus]|uniref:O-antigen ligase family protein n=1 Tax=Vibrio mimicus TaxID=674 RepID=UPI002F934A28